MNADNVAGTSVDAEVDHASSITTGAPVDQRLLKALSQALCDGALPGEIADFDETDCDAAATFVAACANRRPPGIALVRIESLGGQVGQRRMRICIVNDDMPFLVDSVAATIAERGLIVHRLLHPVVCVERDDNGCLTSVEPLCDEQQRRESIMYIEVDRADARTRRDLTAELHRVLADVRAAVGDWRSMQQIMRDDADRLGDEEGAALLRWFADGAMTLLGHQTQCGPQDPTEMLGLLKIPGHALWSPEACQRAMEHFEAGGSQPLILKSDRVSTVHRRVPFDLVVTPRRDGGKLVNLSIHAGLWTSAALATAPEDVPVIRRRLAALDEEFGFDPRGHAGKSLRHAMGELPRDLSVGLDAASVRQLALTSMSLTDRPRPTLMILPSMLGRHLFAFVWLPRDELNTARRKAIAQMLEEASRARLSNWSVELGDGALALIRYTLDTQPDSGIPDVGELDERLVAMVRGWAPSVEEALGDIVGTARATRLALSYVDDFPESYRNRTSPTEAAQDVLRICDLDGPGSRDTRIFHREGDRPDRLHLKTYRLAEVIPLSEAVPVFENFGFSVLEELPTPLDGGTLGYIHDFVLEMPAGGDAAQVMGRAEVVERAVSAVLEGKAENDPFNQLLVSGGLKPRDVVLLRALFRYLRQTGLSYSQATVVDALRRAPQVTSALIGLFDALHDPACENREAAVRDAEAQLDAGLAKVAGIDEDRILRLLRAVISATLRTNAFAPAGAEALAFKLDSSRIPGLPAPLPWREIWVYSPRVEGIHLRGGPVARGGLRWSDRRDDFRTEVLGLVKAQVVKNAVIVPTGAKGGFYPKQLPPPTDRDAWLAEGKDSYRVFIRALLSVTDNIVEGEIVHPEGVTVRDDDDPYFVVAADKGTATFSDVANEIALSRGFWLGDAFASGGSQGYDHKAMGITARGAWVSVQRHFREMGIDVQTQPITVAGVGDMSGDVFGNGMLLSKAIKLVAAFDHRHIFIDPDPEPGRAWEERNRLFNLPRSSWDDYDKALISKGGGVFPRSQKSIPLTDEIRALLGLEAEELPPTELMKAILRAQVDLIWFGGIGTYLKARSESHADVGDPGNDSIRVNAAELRAKAIGEGANLGVTQAARVEFAAAGGRINTDFIDNSAGVDCSDNEVNIKIPLNREMNEGRLAFDDRNRLLADMTDEVARLVLEDNRLQTLALSVAERGGAGALPSLVRVIELLEEAGRLDRQVEGFESNDDLLRRAQENRGLTRPELAILLSHAKMRLQSAIEQSALPEDPATEADLLAAFPQQMQAQHRDAILQHQLRREIIATKVANRFVNRLGVVAPFSLTEEEGASFGQAATAFVAAERLFDMPSLWSELDTIDLPEQVRLQLFEQASIGLQLHVADLLRCTPAEASASELVERLRPGLEKLDECVYDLLRAEGRAEAGTLRDELLSAQAPDAIVCRIVRLFELNGGIGIAMLGQKIGVDEVQLTHAYTKLGEVLGLDWAQSAANHFQAKDQWERLLTAGLARDFEQLRLDFLARHSGADPKAEVDRWVEAQSQRIQQFRRTVERARTASAITAPMLAQLATQARVLLGR